ncbi:hydro-lyase, Fe-S type, tartrate/fumarate subfamily, alpha subunit [Hydrogenobacter thermophilus TK-6]|uniref:Fumarate hydratase alpha subunit n=1 Tax=Hydrogenobacter thermophilus (strain DSM 6534 / IAM 12695 / TK-6) TaxID=608538 RepID=D3DHB5_HYDTT|nr:fumarate hydratase [Hydrogenobacter thermophilus]ADO45154.1 hydro-lyase, Fe-S type, tartrate/fumarate subfamily, alpha subunit [Hydrogenobacter thermophilus TK-6]BAI69217.1 fumarate hydratase alpha subunit [Hydrogenobacter thermophilus TK-6]
MREVYCDEIIKAVKEIAIKANYELPEDVVYAFQSSLEKEESQIGKEVLRQILLNAQAAKEEQMAYCQDTGVAVIFVEIGQNVHIVGGSLIDAINEGIRQAYKEGYLRASMVYDPVFERKNTGDNTPAVIHTFIVPGDRIKIIFAPKGAGSENTSRLAMLKPADGWEGVKKFVLETVKLAGPNACPPLTVGVGIGGNFELCALLSKKALLRKTGERSHDPIARKMEEELIQDINKLGLGPMGFGGKVTAVDVRVELYPCHIASLPVAVNIQCHASRHAEIEL